MHDNNEIYLEFFEGVFNMNYTHLQRELTQIEIQKNNSTSGGFNFPTI